MTDKTITDKELMWVLLYYRTTYKKGIQREYDIYTGNIPQIVADLYATESLMHHMYVIR